MFTISVSAAKSYAPSEASRRRRALRKEGAESFWAAFGSESGFVVKPSEGKTAVEVTIPQGVDATKVTVEVSVKVVSVKPNGAKVKIVSGGADITEFLNMPAADGNGVVDLAKATVKEEIVKEAMDVKNGAVIDLSSGPLGTTGPTIRRHRRARVCSISFARARRRVV